MKTVVQQLFDFLFGKHPYILPFAMGALLFIFFSIIIGIATSRFPF
ncbi:hypothetical protein [Bacillus sp. FJAT-44742]|nr:hypothetical protein [Bacillus sp. FJAT-44742]